MGDLVDRQTLDALQLSGLRSEVCVWRDDECAGGSDFVTILSSGDALRSDALYPVLLLLLAFGMIFPREVLVLIFPPIPIQARWFVIIYAGIELWAGVTGTELMIAASTASTPASTAARTVAAEMPDVSWVWKWIGRPVSSRNALNRTCAADGFNSPAMSLTAMTWAPAFSSSRARPV